MSGYDDEEMVLRRALRLDASERPPRLDAAALARAADALGRRELVATAAVVTSVTAAAVYAATLSDAVQITIRALIPALIAQLQVAASAVPEPLALAVAAVVQPTTLLALLAGLAVAVHASERRGHVHVTA